MGWYCLSGMLDLSSTHMGLKAFLDAARVHLVQSFKTLEGPLEFSDASVITEETRSSDHSSAFFFASEKNLNSWWIKREGGAEEVGTEGAQKRGA